MRMPKPERVALLTPEQKVVYDNWLKEDQIFSALLDQLLEANDQQDVQRAEDLLNQMEESTPAFCEHQRSVLSGCFACQEIEKVLYPEFYDENGESLSPEEIEAIISRELNHDLN